DDARADGDDDDDMGRAGLGRPLPETSPQIEDRHYRAAQVDDAAYERWGVWQRSRYLPGADLAHQLDVDAVVLLAELERHHLHGVFGECRRQVRRRSLRAFVTCRLGHACTC